MYDYIGGTISAISPAEITLDNHGIGYRILISLQTYQKLCREKDAKLYIHHLVREDEEALYGFFDVRERSIFELLISVSGIGPNTARMMLSSLSSEEVETALVSGDVNKIKSVKGIGLKTAQRAIIELKDKLSKESVGGNINLSFAENSSRAEAGSALIQLGFGKSAVEKVLDSILSKEPTISLEEMIKKALKML